MQRKISSRELAVVGNGPTVVGSSGFLGGFETANVLRFLCPCQGRINYNEVSVPLMVDSFKASFVDDFSPISVVLRACTLTKIGLAIIQGIAVAMVHGEGFSSRDSSVHGDSVNPCFRDLETGRGAVLLILMVVTSMPAVLFKSVYVPNIYKRVLTFSQRQISRARAYRNYGFSSILRGHRFSPVRFMSRVLVTLSATMPSLYASSLEVCYV